MTRIGRGEPTAPVDSVSRRDFGNLIPRHVLKFHSTLRQQPRQVGRHAVLVVALAWTCPCRLRTGGRASLRVFRRLLGIASEALGDTKLDAKLAVHIV